MRRLRAGGWTIAAIAQATGLGYATVGRVSARSGKTVAIGTYRRLKGLVE